MGFVVAHRHNHAFARGQAIGLNHNRRAFGSYVSMRLCGIAEGLVACGRNVVFGHEGFGKVF